MVTCPQTATRDGLQGLGRTTRGGRPGTQGFTSPSPRSARDFEREEKSRHNRNVPVSGTGWVVQADGAQSLEERPTGDSNNPENMSEVVLSEKNKIKTTENI